MTDVGPLVSDPANVRDTTPELHFLQIKVEFKELREIETSLIVVSKFFKV